MNHQPPGKVFRHDSWRSRGYIPHFSEAGLVQQVTFRLADSLPASLVKQWREELAREPEARRREMFEKRVAAGLDQGLGSCHLRDPRIGKLVEEALLHFDGERYRMLAWCVMPNHVHSVMETMAGHELGSVVHSWKSFTSKAANRILGRSGTFWQREYHDRFIRDETHLLNALRYVEHNPVTAGLVGRAEDWRFGSAWHRMRRVDD